MRFRAVTFNLHQHFKRWDVRRDLILEELQELRPDILCLNEVSIPMESGRWLWKRAGEVGLTYTYLQQTKTNALAYEEGQGILTRFRVLETGVLDYRSRDRVAQVARLEVDGSAVDVYLTHLHHVLDEDAAREDQIQQLLAWVESRDPPTARLVCGDFNATRDMRSLQRMRVHFTATQEDATFPTPLRYSLEEGQDHPEADGPTFQACLDYLWYQPPLRVHRGGRCFNRPAPRDPSLWPSDHVGVWADLDLDS